MKHDLEPTDNQGYCMECTRCGEHIYIESPSWNKHIDADCPGSVEQRMENMAEELHQADIACHEGTPIMSDFEYDAMKSELNTLAKITGFALPDYSIRKAKITHHQ